MTMEAMVEAFKKKGFGVEKIYNKEARYYRFIIEKYAVEVAGNFNYPAGKDFNLKDLLQREFIDKLLNKWQQAVDEKRWCYDCKHYYTSHMCGYDACNCRVHGSLDVDQKERHPDKTADTCPYYCPNGKRPWYEKYEDKKGESIKNMKQWRTDAMNTVEEVKTVLNSMEQMINDYGVLTIQDIADIMDKPSAYWESKVGWHSINGAAVVKAGDMYAIELPMPIELYETKIKKGESKMKDNDNLMYALTQTTAGHLDIMGQPYPVMVKDVTVNGVCAGEATTLLTVEVVGRYGDPNDKLYPKYPNNSPKTVGAVFDTLNMEQRAAVYELIGRALQGKAVYSSSGDLPKIKDVIFNPPATIVFWADNTKTVVKCQEGDDFDAEKGLTMAITKKLFGNKGNYCEEIKKWTKKYKPEPVEIYMDGLSITELHKMIREAIGLPTEKKEEPEKRWKIWWKRYNEDGKVIGSGVHHTDYEDESSACRDASKFFEHNAGYEFVVSQDNPWEKD